MTKRENQDKLKWIKPQLMFIEPGSAEGKKGVHTDGGGGGTKS